MQKSSSLKVMNETLVSSVRFLFFVSLALCTACGSGDSPSEDQGAVLDVSPVIDVLAQVDPGNAEDLAIPEPDLGPPDMGPDYVEYQGQPDGFIKGGLLANYYAGTTFDPNQLPEEKIDWTLEPSLDLTNIDKRFSGKNHGALFTVKMEGAVYVEETGIYRLIVSASDSVRVRLHEDVVIQAWQMADLFTESVTVKLSKGWHPLELVYARDVYRAHLQLWVEKEGEIPLLGGVTNLGFNSIPVPGNGLDGSAVVVESASWGANISLTANAPVIVNVETFPGDNQIELSEYKTDHNWTVHLPADGSYQVKINIWDIWGRSIAVPTINVDTDPLPDYVEGGLFGRYHNKTDFTKECGYRFDPRIYLPEDIGDGLTSQSFGMNMNNNNFSVRWEGAVKVEIPGEYEFFVGTDDGRRFWVDGQQIVDYWAGTPLSYDSAKISLGLGWHPIKFEMYEGGGSADAKLEWRRPDGIHEIIPSESLGTVLPEEDQSAVPVISGFETSVNDANNDDNDAMQYKWSTNVLSTCTLVLQGLDASITIPFTAPSTGFKFRYMMPPYGPITATIYVTSMYGVSGQSVNETVDSPTVFVPPDE